MLDVRIVFEKTKAAEYVVALDIKAAYNMVVLRDVTKKYTGLMMQDSVFMFNMLMFGCKNATAHL